MKNKSHPVAPPVYRPQPTPKVLQKRTVMPRHAMALPTRPQAPNILHSKTTTAMPRPAMAPPTRPQAPNISHSKTTTATPRGSDNKQIFPAPKGVSHSRVTPQPSSPPGLRTKASRPQVLQQKPVPTPAERRAPTSLPVPFKSQQNAIQMTPFDFNALEDRLWNELWTSKEKDENFVEKIFIIQDLKKLRDILITPKLYQPALRYLDSQLQKRELNNITLDLAYHEGRRSSADATKKVLSRELADKERKCGFPGGVPVYWKVLSEKAFSKFSQEGRAFKDVGAGFEHGEYTHRIQWYVLLYTLSNGFTLDISTTAPPGYMFTPCELFRKINTCGVKLKETDWPKNKPSGGNGLWDAIFDRNSDQVDLSDALTGPEFFNVTLFDKALANEFPGLGMRKHLGAFSKEYPTLSRAVTRIYRRRKQKMPKDSNEELATYATRKTTGPKPRYQHFTDLVSTTEKSGVLIRKK